jgi:hypothetical protein
MTRPTSSSHPFVSRISLVGRDTGLVKNLGGFRKQHHTVPDSVNAATTAFLGKICSGELGDEAEQYYQRAKTAMGYRRADLTIEISSPGAVLTTRDFTLELAYALVKPDPASYERIRTLHSLRGAELVKQPEFNGLFAAGFSSMVFNLAKGVKVEAVIDAVEARGTASGLTVSYPSDCRQCRLMVAGVAAEVSCDGATLEMQFARAGSPAELVEAFLAVRSAFILSKDPVLAGLL